MFMIALHSKASVCWCENIKYFQPNLCRHAAPLISPEVVFARRRTFCSSRWVGRRERCYEVLPKASLGDPDHSGHARHWPPPALLEFPENLWVQKCTRLKSGPRLMGRWSRLLKSNKYHPNIHSTFYILHPKVRFFCKILGLANFPGRK